MNKESIKEPHIQIREAVLQDAESIFKVQKNAWIATYPNEALGITPEMIRGRFHNADTRIARWQTTLGTETSKVWLATEDGVVVGFCGVQKSEAEHRISSIYIEPTKQGKGIGSALLAQALVYLGKDRDIVLDVVSYNKNAIGFYTKHSFKIVGPVPDEKLLSIGDKKLPEVQMKLKTS